MHHCTRVSDFVPLSFSPSPCHTHPPTGYAVLTGASAGITGKGTAVVVLNEAAKTIEFSVTVTGLSGAVTAAHFHGPASIGQDGGPVFTLTALASKVSASGILTGVSTEQFEYFKSGKMYVNVHTAANSAGEIRGQVLVDASTIGVGMLSGAKSVPALVSSASGTVAVRFVDGGASLWYAMTVSDGFNGDISAAHFHGAADASSAAGVLFAISGLNNNARHVEGKWENLTADQKTFVQTGKVYVNVHTTNVPSGEIRSQIEGSFPASPAPAPNAASLYG